jgi:hypothetical protein
MCCVVHLRGYVGNLFRLPQHLIYENEMDKNAQKYRLNLDTGFDFRNGFAPRMTAVCYSQQIQEVYKYKQLSATADQRAFELSFRACCELIFMFFRDRD